MKDFQSLREYLKHLIRYLQEEYTGVYEDLKRIDPTYRLIDNGIPTRKIKNGAVTPEKISVNELSAISANLGSIISGLITGAVIRTAESGSRIYIDKDTFVAYDSENNEIIKFYLTGENAGDMRIGNIKITPNTIESIGYETEGIQIKDTGEIHLKNQYNYKMQLRPDGIYIYGKMFVVEHPPSGDDYIRNVVLRKTPGGDIISESSYSFGAKNGQFIKRSAYADDTPTYPDGVFVTYTINEGTWTDEPQIFNWQNSVVAIITSDSLLDASYVRNLIVGKITNPAGNTYFDLLKGKLNIESIDDDEDNKFVIGDPSAGAGLRYDKSKKELLMSGIFSTTGSKNWDSKDDFDGNKSQVDIDTILGKILLERELAQWIQTTQADFELGSPTNIDTTTEPGTFRLLGDNWLETLTADFNAGVIKDNVIVTNDEIKFPISDEAINQQQTSGVAGGYNSLVPLAQSFKVSINCIVTRIAVNIAKSGSPGNWTLYLKADNNNSPGATLASVTILASSVTAGFTDVITDIPDTGLTANTRYWIYTPAIGDASNRYVWQVSEANNPYPDGNAWGDGSHITTRDFMFKIYEQHYPTSGQFRSQEKTLEVLSALGKFYENHSGSGLTFKVRRYKDGAWSDFVIVTNNTKINLDYAEKVQYDITFSGSGTSTPVVYDVKTEYIRASGDLISQSYRFGTNLNHWDPMVITKVLNGQTVTIKTQTAPDVDGSPGDWEEEKSLDAQDKPTSTIYTDTWFRWRSYLSTTDGTKTPVVYDITAKARKKYYSNGYDRLVWSFGSKVSYTTYSFIASEPANTNAKIRFRIADTEGDLAGADWTSYYESTSGDLNLTDSIWIEVEVYLETTDTDVTPDFDKLTVDFTGGIDAEKVDGKHASDLKHGVADDDETAIKVKIGSFTCPASTGNYSVTGVGFKPRYVEFMVGYPATDTCVVEGTGWMDYLGNQAAQTLAIDISADINVCGLLSDRCIAINIILASDFVRAIYVSMNSDGFTINFTSTHVSCVVKWKAVR